ncbi:MAG: HAD-IA family hydrolase, partial [Burkholderiaceae bacterium]|nr:HAD-IA family hydrolase [Burkholderiaceae bacterium]
PAASRNCCRIAGARPARTDRAAARQDGFAARLLIFDVDGTLAETERDGHRIAFNRAFAEARLPWEWDERLYGELLAVTGGKERIARFAARFAPDWLAAADARQRIAELHARKNAHYAAIAETGELPLRAGVAALFDALSDAGIRLAIATTTSRANVEVLLRTSLGPDAAHRFEAIVCGEDVARKKPDPEAYRLALHFLRLPADRCVAVEDSANGLRAALGAGIATLVVRSLYTRAEDFSGALAVYDGYGDGRAAAGDARLLNAGHITALGWPHAPERLTRCTGDRRTAQEPTQPLTEFDPPQSGPS